MWRKESSVRSVTRRINDTILIYEETSCRGSVSLEYVATCEIQGKVSWLFQEDVNLFFFFFFFLQYCFDVKYHYYTCMSQKVSKDIHWHYHFSKCEKKHEIEFQFNRVKSCKINHPKK